MELDERLSKRKALLVQIYYGILANLCSFSPGMTLSYPAVTLPAFKNGTEFSVTLEEASWIASLSAMSTPIGCLITGPLMDHFGRKYTILLVNIPAIVGWLLIAFAVEPMALNMIYAGRVFTGISLGMLNSPTAVYISEICRDKIRGMLINWTTIGFSAGMVIVYGLGALYPDDWRMVARICIIFPVIAAISCFLLPESPSWLMIQQRKVEAEENFRKIRGLKFYEKIPQTFNMELKNIEDYVDNLPQQKTSFLKSMLEFQKPTAYKPFFIMSTLFFFLEFSGVYVILIYSVDILQQLGVALNPYHVALILGLTRLCITFLQSYMSMRLGRRKLLVSSGACMFVMLLCLTVFRYLQFSNSIGTQTLTWLPVLFLILYIFTATMGFLTLPWSMVGEVFPLNIRGLAVGITTCFANLLEFVILKFYPVLQEAVGDISYILSLFTVCMFFSVIFVYLFLPETQGKTLMEIEQGFCKKKKNYGTPQM